ncbi:MAG: Na+/H+ antiporter [Amaricoccus sp.]
MLILLAVVVSGWLARLLPVDMPLPLVQIATGAVMAAGTGLGLRLDPDVFFLLFLPPLLFLDGWRIPKDGLLRDFREIADLALGLVVFSVIGIGFLVHWMIPAMPLPVAFALAAVLSPTDPVAVGAILRKAPVPPRLVQVLEGESLLNDASGLVCMRFAVAAMVTGGFSVLSAAGTFVWLVAGGITAGVATTLGITLLQGRIAMRLGEEPGSKILVSLLLPFGAYLLAEGLGASGILAAVAAGIAMAYVEQSGRAMPATRMRRIAVWDMVQFGLNGAMFVLIGEQLPTIARGAVTAVGGVHGRGAALLLVHVVVITLALVLLRFVWVWVSLRLRPFRRDPGGQPAMRALLVVAFAGARGSITLAGILTLPLEANGAPFPARDLAITLAAGVVILSIATAGIALPWLLAGFGPLREDEAERSERRARKAAALAAIDAIERVSHDEHSISARAVTWMEAAARVSSLYRTRIDGMSKTGDEAEEVRRTVAIDRELRLAGLRAERATYYRLGRERKLSDALVRRLVAEIDQAETRLTQSF